MDRTLLGPLAMTRFVYTGAALLAACLLAPTAAAAQEDLSICLETVGDRDDDEFGCAITNVPVGIDECDANPALTFTVRGVPSTASVLDFWRAEGNDCAPVEQRDGDMDTCVHLSVAEEADGMEVTVTTNLQELIDCSVEQAGVIEQIFIFAGTSSPERGDVSYGVLQIAVDTRRPPAPTDVEGGSGESAIPVTWESSGSDLYRHNVYVVRAGESLMGTSPDAGTATPDAGTGTDAGTSSDAGTGTDAGAASDAGTAADASIPDGAVGVAHDGALHDATIGTLDDAGGGGGTIGCDTSGVPAGIVPTGAEPTLTVTGDRRSASINAADLGLAVGETAAVVVTAVDKARNESAISEATCIEVVDTVSFCERVGCGDDGCSCSAAGADDGRGPWALGLGAMILGVTAWRRRTVRRRRG